MPTWVVQEALDQRLETAFLKSMEAALDRLDHVEQEIIRTAVESGRQRDNDIVTAIEALQVGERR